MIHLSPYFYSNDVHLSIMTSHIRTSEFPLIILPVLSDSYLDIHRSDAFLSPPLYYLLKTVLLLNYDRSKA